MKDILFRGKRVDNDEWVYGYLLEAVNCNTDKKSTFIMGQDATYYGYGEFACSFEVIPETVGQFTGLTDKNGVKIFEGDILKVSYDDGTAYTTEVYSYGSTLCVDIEGEDYDFTAIDFAVDIWKDNWCKFEVIGNIYDNKELLGNKNNG